MIAPIRRGTAERLGLNIPRPVHTVWIRPDLTTFNRLFKAAFRARLSAVEAVQAELLAGFQRIADDLRTAMQPPVDARQEPNSCRWCAIPERQHYTQYKNPVGWHQWHVPTDEQRKARMLARRASRP